MQVIFLVLMTDSLALFDILRKTLVTTKKQIIIGLQTVKYSTQEENLDDFAFILSKHDFTDRLTKVKNQLYLVNILEKEKLVHLKQ